MFGANELEAKTLIQEAIRGIEKLNESKPNE